MKRFLSLFLAVCLGIFGTLSLAGCNKSGSVEGGGEIDTKYYKYNVESDVFDKTEYLQIDGNSCALVKETDGTTVTANGSITFMGNKFTISCASELLGIPLTTVMSGEREANGVMRVDSQTVLGMTSTPATEYEVTYYCQGGVKPAAPYAQYTITFNANGGKFDNDASTKTAKTNADGVVTLPAAPTLDGYDFAGFYVNKTGGGTAISANTKFDHSMTVYARWTEKNASASVYYLYNVNSDSYDMNDRLEINGGSCSLIAIDGGETVRLDGRIEFTREAFAIYFFNAFDTGYAITMVGEREANGVMRIERIDSDVTGGAVSNAIMYYCPNNVKPVAPISRIYEITFYAEPGKFSDNTQVKKVSTNEHGKVVDFPEDPTRNGYKFKGFYRSGVFSSVLVDADYVFDSDSEVYAKFVELHTVTFRVEGETIETRTVEHGAPLGDIYDVISKTPNLSEIMSDKGYYTLDGWYENDYKKYVGYTEITKDVVLDAKFYTQSEYNYIMSDISEWSEPGHLYLQYKRKDQMTSASVCYFPVDRDSIKWRDEAYADWLLWAWPDGGVGRAFEPIYVGTHGIVFDIDMKKTYTDGGWDPITKTHDGKSVNFYNKGFNFKIFNDRSRQNGDEFWESDGGNCHLPIEAFEFWEIDEKGNQVGETYYVFDTDIKIHVLFEQDYVSQSIEDKNVFMMLFGSNDGAIYG